MFNYQTNQTRGPSFLSIEFQFNQQNSVALNWVSLLILEKMDGKVRASCLVDLETEHELKAVRKRGTSFVSDATSVRFLFSLSF